MADIWLNFEAALKAFADENETKMLFAKYARIPTAVLATYLAASGSMDIGAAESDVAIPMGDIAEGRFVFVSANQDLTVKVSNYHPHPSGADDECIGCWRLDETNASDNAHDSGPNALHGTAVSSPGVVTGVVRNARSFGSGKRFTQAAGTLLQPQAMTIAMWIYVTSPTSGGIIYVCDSISHNPYLLETTTAGTTVLRFRISCTDDNQPNVTALGGNLAVGWHHVMAEFTGSALKLYIDGVLNNTQTDVGNGVVAYHDPSGNGYTWSLGARGYLGLQPWPGYVDEVAHYSVAKGLAFAEEYSQGLDTGSQEFDLKVRITGEQALLCGMLDYTSLGISGAGNDARLQYFLAGVGYP